MAGIGVQLNRIFEKNTITENLIGVGYSIVLTIAPMLFVILNIVLMMQVLGVSTVGYTARGLFSCTVMYIFIFALITSSPFNVVLAKYLSDVLYEEKYENILPCYYAGLMLNVLFSSLVGIPFCFWEYFVGHIDPIYIFTGFFGYISFVFVFYTMLYMLICKDYRKMAFFYFVSMLFALGLSAVLVYVFSVEKTYSMLLSLSVGFFLIACMEFAMIKSYFRENSNQYRRVFHYFKVNWKLALTNFLYIIGLFTHNFVFWNSDLRIVVANSFICAEPYDMASCLAMFTNISASVIFTSRMEMYFHGRYRSFTEAVIGGRWADIEKAKKRMFFQLSNELMNLTRSQFIVSILLFILFVVFFPRYGFSGMVMRIYPSLAAGYFILYLMYASLVFLYYFDDLTGALKTGVCFCVMTLIGSIFAASLTEIWYGMGLFVGAFAGWCVAYSRLRWIERNIDIHVFCRGELLRKGVGEKPPQKVYDVSKRREKIRHRLGGRKKV